MSTIWCYVVFSLILYANCDVIELRSGFINGTVDKSSHGRLFHKFYGVPYAEPPVGELRFKAPITVKPWSGVRDCSEQPSKCIQPGIFSIPSKDGIIGREDCLYLNVFVPNELLKPSGKTPVMVGIHGGAFVFGSGTDYNPDYFMDRDVIFVSVNYRLGVLGFFGMNNDQISGNFGMKDQAMALRWVRENIARFGGDPGNVTLVGESAGAASVHLHMFSPLSKGLFQKAILQSGSAFCQWAHYDVGHGEAAATAFLVVSGCYHRDWTEVLKCLQRIQAEDFYDLEKRLYVWNNHPRIMFKPMIETNVSNEPFLTAKPAQNGYLTNVPWITGINSGEGALAVSRFLKNGAAQANALNSDRKSALPVINHYYNTAQVQHMDNITQKIIDFYFGTKKIGFETAHEFVDMITDSAFMYPFAKTVQSRRDRQYVYFYDHRGSFSMQSFANLKIDLGVSHADEIPLLFRIKLLESFWKPEDRNVSETLVKFWANFAITGDPNGNSEAKIWKQVETEDVEYLHIKSNSLIMEKKLLKERFDFWESLPTGWKYV